MADIDGDGDVDVLVVNGDALTPDDSHSHNAIYINEGAGELRKAVEEIQADDGGGGVDDSCIFANDGENAMYMSPDGRHLTV